MGVTNSRYPEEICEGQIQVNQGSMMGLSYDQLDVSTEEMENVDLYMQSLGVPARRNVNDPQVIKVGVISNGVKVMMKLLSNRHKMYAVSTHWNSFSTKTVNHVKYNKALS